MPSISDINKTSAKKKFKKVDYRPYIFEETAKGTVNNHSETILEIDCRYIVSWKYNDRPTNELGDIEGLANEFKNIGQQQPCIVRLIANDKDYKYELIAGERRCHAAKLANMPLKVIVKEVTDSEAALIQSAENNNRKDLSDYAKGMSYHNLISKNIITQKELAEKLNLSKQSISRFMSFAKIPADILDKINDFTKISSYTAEAIKQVCKRSERHKQIVLDLVDKLQLGKIGAEKLAFIVEDRINASAKNTINYNSKIINDLGQNLFNWKKNKKGQFSINFSKEINLYIEQNHDVVRNNIIDLLAKIFK